MEEERGREEGASEPGEPRQRRPGATRLADRRSQAAAPQADQQRADSEVGDLKQDLYRSRTPPLGRESVRDSSEYESAILSARTCGPAATTAAAERPPGSSLFGMSARRGWR